MTPDQVKFTTQTKSTLAGTVNGKRFKFRYYPIHFSHWFERGVTPQEAHAIFVEIERRQLTGFNPIVGQSAPWEPEDGLEVLKWWCLDEWGDPAPADGTLIEVDEN